MDGIILINKPTGLTSYDVIRNLKKQLNMSKIGHAGTLDPMASGLLVVLVGKATKLSDYLLNQTKEYEGEITFGFLYDTLDITGNLLDLKKPNLTQNKLVEAFKYFNGLKYQQMPPKYSALKIKGKKAYQLARENQEVVLMPREVEIKELKLLTPLKANKINFSALASKGTYIRSLVNDIGNYLNEFATLSKLNRISSGDFNLKEASTLTNYKLISLEEYFKDKKVVVANPYLVKLVKNGITLDERQEKEAFDFIVKDENQNLIAYYVKKNQNEYKPVIIFWGILWKL